jgi:aromatic ring hydroxylase
VEAVAQGVQAVPVAQGELAELLLCAQTVWAETVALAEQAVPVEAGEAVQQE